MKKNKLYLGEIIRIYYDLPSVSIFRLISAPNKTKAKTLLKLEFPGVRPKHIIIHETITDK